MSRRSRQQIAVLFAILILLAFPIIALASAAWTAYPALGSGLGLSIYFACRREPTDRRNRAREKVEQQERTTP